MTTLPGWRCGRHCCKRRAPSLPVYIRGDLSMRKMGGGIPHRVRAKQNGGGHTPQGARQASSTQQSRHQGCTTRHTTGTVCRMDRVAGGASGHTREVCVHHAGWTAQQLSTRGCRGCAAGCRGCRQAGSHGTTAGASRQCVCVCVCAPLRLSLPQSSDQIRADHAEITRDRQPFKRGCSAVPRTWGSHSVEKTTHLPYSYPLNSTGKGLTFGCP
jgi:hypothetical protein